MTELSYEFIFDAAHRFNHKPVGHKYRALHGHSFRAEVAVRGEPNAATGFIVDFETLEQACAQLREKLDHNFLNEIPGLEIPSLENISRWIWRQLAPQFSGLYRVTVRRDSLRQGCSYFGEAA
jgi:6-pyruvoyltetrahydropterin/6-carboxytetrahydropterin synthase